VPAQINSASNKMSGTRLNVLNACLDADQVGEAVKSTRTIHVFTVDEKLEPAFRRGGGKMVVLRGRSFAAQTTRHHAPS
jgi:hypothetical protein